jgi:hypothetical protein
VLAGVVLSAGGCRSTRSEVPPGKPYATTGGQPPAVGFSSEPHPGTGGFMGGFSPLSPSGSLVQDGKPPSSSSGAPVYGTPTTANDSLGAPTANQYGPPGTAGTVPSAPGTAAITNSLLKAGSAANRTLMDPSNISASERGSSGVAYP